MSSLLTVSEAHKTYPGATEPTLAGVNLDLKAGEAFVILGQTGSGKSTLLRAVAGLEDLDSGSIQVAPKSRLALVFQEPALFPWCSVQENIALGTGYRRNKNSRDRAYLSQLIDRLGLAGLENRSVQELSGGQAQRVAIGRALAIRPSLLLLDEPFSALDPATRSELQVWLRSLIDQLKLTLLMVSHDVQEALTLADRIGYFQAGAGFTRYWRPAQDQVSEREILSYYRQNRKKSSDSRPAVKELSYV
ncbi:MAG: ATP-binding cassette domain-containing protein [Rothia sp. (in: high G+C Gram-positive bacteria)]|nr:ATP-binding cassette domain-containing protein [Rothia sp. (in: high G+C Gram-positive bacteria)]